MEGISKISTLITIPFSDFVLYWEKTQEIKNKPLNIKNKHIINLKMYYINHIFGLMFENTYSIKY